jgi:hypothetical protein
MPEPCLSVVIWQNKKKFPFPHKIYQGDSGGPLLKYHTEKGHYEIVGIASSIMFRNSAKERPKPGKNKDSLWDLIFF